MGALITAFGYAVYYMFKKGSVYNPDMPSLDNLPPETPYIPASPVIIAPDAPKLPATPSIEPTAPNLPLLSDNKANIRKSVRVIGDDEGLVWLEKDLLCDVCACESGFVLNARLENSPRSVDRGLFQWNNYWHPEITDEMAYDPEIATRLACKAIKQGKVKAYWNASRFCWNKTGKYNSFL